jgi:hypothetical protein
MSKKEKRGEKKLPVVIIAQASEEWASAGPTTQTPSSFFFLFYH